MNILDIPFVIELFFVISTLVFAIALYAILPVFIYKKIKIYKPSFMSSLWHKYVKNIFLGIGKTSFPAK